MMKIASLLLLLCASLVAFAQKELLVLNEQNKLTYFQIKNIPANSSTESMNYTVDFLKRNYPGITLYKDDVKDSTLEGNGKVLLYKKSMLSGQEDGEVTYQLRIDFKNGKYRLLLTNFNYTPYKRTRFGTFAPVAGIVVSLDNPGKSIGAKQADNYLNQIGAYSAAFDKQLEAYLQNPLASKENKPALKKVNTTNW